MKALTICQPWAWAIVHGPKRIENRTWPTNYRGTILIHAGKSRGRLATALPFLRSLGLDPPEDLTYAAIVGLAELVDVRPVELVDQCAASQRTHGNFAEGPLCWLLEDVRALEPIPCRGKLGLWIPPAEIVAAVERQGVIIPG